ncbi:MAG TPA: hypothetical protein VJB57_03785 [Dehalococcoidia bacterium]|nr:hypothetical protein [Dehalococcoidia bacterium]
MNIRIFVWPTRTVALLAIVLAALVATDIVLQKIEYDRRGKLDYFVHWGWVEPEPDVSYPGWLFEEARFRFDLDQELSIKSWYDSLLLLLVSASMLSVATTLKRNGARNVWYWRSFAVLFVFLSLDEVAALHEILGGRPDSPGSRLTDLLGLRGFVFFDWVPAVAALVVVIAVLFLPVLIRLPWGTRLILGSAAALYLAGALAVETLGGNYVSEHGWDSMTYRGFVALEETLEGAGLLVAIFGLLTYDRALASASEEQPKEVLRRLDLLYAAGLAFAVGVLFHAGMELMAADRDSKHESPAQLALPAVSCGGSVDVTFAWTPAAGAASQWLDLSLMDDGFSAGSFLTSGPLESNTRQLTWNGLTPGVAHYWRINALTANGWVTSTTGSFVPCGGPQTRGIAHTCYGDSGAVVTFYWSAPSPPGVSSWLDISLAGDSSFAPESFLSAGPLVAGQTELTLSKIPANVVHYWRVGTDFDGSWAHSDTGTFVALC